MSISIQTNVNSLVAQQNLNVTNKFQSQTITQLTSGYRINSSGDDAAGLAVANKFRSTVAELTQGVANGNDAVAQLQIMDGGMSNISQILDRLKTLATQSASGTFTGDRSTLNSEFQTDIQEIDRQAQSIGLDTGSTFAKSLSVYLGEGTGSGDGNGGTQALMNASVGMDLSQSTVDSGSLGLKGLKVIAGNVDAAGTDIGTGSSNGTTVQDIVSALAGNAQAKGGYATFDFSGPGFSDNSKVSVSANMSGVSDTATLVTAINQAISNAAGGATQADQALKNAGIVATVNTDQFGHQQLAFSSSNTAFQVQAGDQMANALMGNFATPGSATGKAITTTVTGATAGVSTAVFNPTNVSVQISGAGLAAPVNLILSSSDKVVSDATSDVIKQVQQNSQLQGAGISVALTSDNKLQFTSATGSSFNVSSVGDSSNALGLGTFVTTSALNGAAAYSDITAGTSLSAAATGNGTATLGFSLNGGATGGITAATVTGSVTGTGYNGGGTPNGTVGNAAGALGSMTLILNGGSSPVTVDFTLDANNSATETAQQAADFINSQIQSQAGYGSDVKLATVDSATKTIVLSGPADGAGTISASGNAATALGLTAASGANMVAASGVAGNTVSVNLSGGDAKGAVATGAAPASANIATGTNTMALTIDGVAVNADFSKDANGAGSVASFTSGVLGVNGAASTLDVSSLQGSAGTLTTGVLGNSGVTTSVDLTSLNKIAATYKGTSLAADDGTTTLNVGQFAAKAGDVTGTSLGTPVSNNVSLAGLDLKQFASSTATAVGRSLGTEQNAQIDLSKFGKTAATATTTALAATGLDFSSYAAQPAKLSGTAVAANDTDTISALANLDSNPSNELIINGTAIDVSTCTSLASVATAIGTHVANVTATAGTNGVLTLSTTTHTGTTFSIDVANNAASLALGFSTPGQNQDSTATGSAAVKLQVGIDGNAVEDIDLSTVTNISANDNTGLLYQINHTLSTTDSGDGYSGTYAAVNANGTITLTSHNKGATGGTPGQITIVNNGLSQALGLASGTADTENSGLDATKLMLNIDGLGTIGVDVSGDTTVGQVATDINAVLAGATSGPVIYGANYNGVASGSTGALALTGHVSGSAGKVQVVDNDVAQALKLTAGTGDLQTQGNDGTKLELNLDGIGKVGVDISQATDLTGVVAAINNQVKLATGYTGGNYNTVAYKAQDSLGAVNGAIEIKGYVTGATSGSVSVSDNQVSRMLGLTSGSTVTNKGTDLQTLDLQMDGGKQLSIDLTAVGGGAATVTALATAITAYVKGSSGYNDGAAYANACVAGTAGDVGKLILTSGVSGGSLTVKNNAVSQFLGLVTGTTADTVKSRADQTLNLQIDGNQEVEIDLRSILGTSATLTDIARTINQTLVTNTAAGYGTAYANAATANANGTITLSGVTGGGTLTVLNSTASTSVLNLTTSGSNASNTGEAAQTLGISIDGKATTQVSFAGITGGKTPTLQNIADAINTQLTNDANYGAAYANAKANPDGTITIASKGTGSVDGKVTVYNTAAGQALGLTSGIGASSTVSGKDESLANVVSFLNQTAQQALGTSTDAKIVSLDASGNVVIASQTKGANSSVAVDSAGTTGNLASALQLGWYVDSAATGQARSAQSVVDSLKVAFNSNSTLQQAGITAQINQATNSLEISSSNGTQFRVDAWGTKNGSNDSDLGFGDTGTAFTNANALTPKSNATVIDTQGASAIGTFANGTKNAASIKFQSMQFGNDDQSISISANSAAGVPQTPLTITLQNDSQAQTGASIDAAINTINTKLQQSENATLRSITAVSETAPDGSESINFISSLSSFNVSVSSSAGAAVGDGLNAGKAQTFSSAMNGSASSIAIDTQQGAQQALLAISSAVAKLGTAQAAIGI